MDSDQAQINQFFVGVERRAFRWLNFLSRLLVPWRSRRLWPRGVCLWHTRGRQQLLLRTQ